LDFRIDGRYVDGRATRHTIIASLSSGRTKSPAPFSFYNNGMREMLIHRPLVLFAICLILGIVAVTNWVAAILLLAMVLAVRHLKSSAICIIAFLIGAIMGPTPNRPIFAKHWIDTDATVISVPRLYPTEVSAQIEVQGMKLTLSGPATLPIALGQTIHVKGDVKSLDE